MDGGPEPIAPPRARARVPSRASRDDGERPQRARRTTWMRIALPLLAALALLAAWQWTPLREWLDPERIARVAEPLRHAWYGGLAAVLAYVALELIFFPLFALVLLTGTVFGPWLGPVYALLGAMASGAVGFLLGRRLGRSTVERWIGQRGAQFGALLRRNGVVAVFLARKIPLPYTLTNLVLGASGLKLRDFLIGSLLGLGALTMLLAAIGDRLAQQRGSLSSIAVAGGLVIVTASIAWMLNRRLRRTDREREEP